MPRRPGRKRIAGGFSPTERADMMRLKATEAKKAGDIYEAQFAQGTRYWEYWMRIVQPYLGGLRTDPDLTKEQRMIAVKEFYRMLPDAIFLTLSKVKLVAKQRARTMVVTVPAGEVKPAMPASSSAPYL